MVYHALNRGNARLLIFEDDEDYAAFERTLGEAVTRYDMRLLAYCLMPNHFHLVVWPRLDGELTQFMRWLTMTHTQRWHAHRHSAGSGHLYQGRFKSFPVQDDGHLLTVCRYVEQRPSRAGRAGPAMAVGEPLAACRQEASGGAGPEPLADRAAVRLEKEWHVEVAGRTRPDRRLALMITRTFACIAEEYDVVVVSGLNPCPVLGHGWCEPAYHSRSTSSRGNRRDVGRPRKGGW